VIGSRVTFVSQCLSVRRGRTELNVLENSWLRNNHASLLQFAMHMTSKLLETRDVMNVKKG